MFDGLLSPLHWLLIGFIALILFGPRRLPELGESLGKAIRQFKSAIKSDDV